MMQPIVKFLFLLILTSSCSKVLVYEKVPSSLSNSIKNNTNLFIYKKNDSIIALKGYSVNGQMISNRSKVEFKADSIVYFDTAFVKIKDSITNQYSYSKIKYVSNRFLTYSLEPDTNEYFYYYNILSGSTPQEVTIIDTLIYNNKKLLLLFYYTGGTAGRNCHYYLINENYKDIPTILGSMNVTPNLLESERNVDISILKPIKNKRELISIFKLSSTPMLEHPIFFNDNNFNFRYKENSNESNQLKELKTLFEEIAIKHASKIFNN